MTNEKEIIRILAPYLVAYPQCKVTAEALIVYANALKTLSLTQIQMAMDKLIRTSKFFPSVAEIYEDAAMNQTTESMSITAAVRLLRFVTIIQRAAAQT